ncbi:unnamed protein product [Schistosoma spindalis]|nr:unnamed protein product [Schistosoma spindale]
MLVVTSMSDFNASAGILSGPAAFALLICLMAILISSVVGGLASIGRSVCCFDVRWVRWSRPIQEFLEVLYPSVLLLLNFSDWSSFFVFDQSIWFPIISLLVSSLYRKAVSYFLHLKLFPPSLLVLPRISACRF